MFSISKLEITYFSTENKQKKVQHLSNSQSDSLINDEPIRLRLNYTLAGHICEVLLTF